MQPKRNAVGTVYFPRIHFEGADGIAKPGRQQILDIGRKGPVQFGPNIVDFGLQVIGEIVAFIFPHVVECWDPSERPAITFQRLHQNEISHHQQNASSQTERTK